MSESSPHASNPTPPALPATGMAAPADAVASSGTTAGTSPLPAQLATAAAVVPPELPLPDWGLISTRFPLTPASLSRPPGWSCSILWIPLKHAYHRAAVTKLRSSQHSVYSPSLPLPSAPPTPPAAGIQCRPLPPELAPEWPPDLDLRHPGFVGPKGSAPPSGGVEKTVCPHPDSPRWCVWAAKKSPSLVEVIFLPFFASSCPHSTLVSLFQAEHGGMSTVECCLSDDFTGPFPPRPQSAVSIAAAAASASQPDPTASAWPPPYTVRARGNQVLCVGIIDVLQQYNAHKALEHFFKALAYDGTAISSVDAATYARRFEAFIAAHLI